MVANELGTEEVDEKFDLWFETRLQVPVGLQCTPDLGVRNKRHSL